MASMTGIIGKIRSCESTVFLTQTVMKQKTIPKARHTITNIEPETIWNTYEFLLSA